MNLPDIRKLADHEHEEADLVWTQAFRGGNREALDELRAYRERFGERIVRFGVWDSSGMQATLQMMTGHSYFGPEATLPSTYISSIACLPAARGRDYGGAGLIHILGHLREAGQLVTTLCPANYGYYTRLGWDWVSVRRYYRTPSRVLPVDPETDRVRAATIPDRAGISAMYEQFARRYRGMPLRELADWNELLCSTSTHETYTYLYERDGLVEGYLVYGSKGTAEHLFLPEFLCITPRAQQGLLGLLHRHSMQVAAFSWDAPVDDGLWSQFLHREMEVNLMPTYVGRVVDVAGALQAWKPAAADGAFTVEVRDGCAPWNDGTWGVEFEAAGVQVHKTDKDADVRMDIRAFSQAFFGVLTFDALRRQERLEVVGEVGAGAMSAFLSGPPMWCGP